jgi:hypothetical protein
MDKSHVCNVHSSGSASRVALPYPVPCPVLCVMFVGFDMLGAVKGEATE